MESVFSCIEEEKVLIRNNKLTININKNIFSSTELLKIGRRLKYVLENEKNRNIEIVMNIRVNLFKDNLVVMLLESMIYEIFKNTKSSVKLKLSIKEKFRLHPDSWILYSLLREHNNGKIDRDRFIYTYETEDSVIRPKNKRSGKKHLPSFFRKRVNYTEDFEDKISSTLLPEVSAFLRVALIELDSDALYNLEEDILHIISELGENSLEHSRSDFILEIHVIDAKRLGRDKLRGKNVTITIMSLSEKYLHTDLKKVLYEKKEEEQLEMFFNAHHHHKQYFNENYTEDDFIMISSFQKGISSRKDLYGTGGTGLFLTLGLLFDKLNFSSDAKCYVLSKESIVFFEKEKIKEKDGQIGFNTSSNYLTDLPDQDVISKTDYPIKGVCFFLNLFMENKQKEMGDINDRVKIT